MKERTEIRFKEWPKLVMGIKRRWMVVSFWNRVKFHPILRENLENSVFVYRWLIFIGYAGVYRYHPMCYHIPASFSLSLSLIDERISSIYLYTLKMLPQFHPKPFWICNIFVSVHLITPIGKGCVYSFVKLVLVLSCLGDGVPHPMPTSGNFKKLVSYLTTLSGFFFFFWESKY